MTRGEALDILREAELDIMAGIPPDDELVLGELPVPIETPIADLDTEMKKGRP